MRRRHRADQTPTRPPATARQTSRRCACGRAAGLDGECEECRRKRLTGERSRSQAAPAPERKPEGAGEPGTGYEFERVPITYAGRGAADGGTLEEEGERPVTPGTIAEGEQPAPMGDKPKAKAPATTTISTPRQASYTINAKTLEEAAAVVSQREEAGLTEWFPNLSYKTKDGVITSATVTVNLTVTMPNWPGAAKLSKAAKAEWGRFYRALADHEQGHVDLVHKHLENIADSLIGKTEDEAKAAFQQAIDDLQMESDKYDQDTDHGRKRGTIIDTTVE